MNRQFDPATPELMDRAQPVTPELERDLANLRALNRAYGSHRLIREFLRRWLKPSTAVRVLDLATASGDIPRLIARFSRERNARVQIDAIDQQRASIQIAQTLSREYPEVYFHCADLFEWNPSEKYDLVFCSLALHHFGEDEAVRVLRRCRELSRGGVLVSDLRRARWMSCAIWLLTATIYRERMTRIDARLSAARAFSFDEMGHLAQRAGWRDFGHRRFAIGRQAIWIDPP
ncbi:MAG: methyltransferase domain-containing protein [Verrucomicrobia bacterium]|nr:methyltransferase domain-containing protein [Verrucomicrobiota bacterium]